MNFKEVRMTFPAGTAVDSAEFRQDALAEGGGFEPLTAFGMLANVRGFRACGCIPEIKCIHIAPHVFRCCCQIRRIV